MTEIYGIFVPTIWAHEGLIDYFYATPELKAAVTKDAAVAAHFSAQEGKACVTVPTRMALKVAADTHKVAVAVPDTKLSPAAYEAKCAEIVPVAEWADCTAKVAVAVAAKEAVGDPVKEPIVAQPKVGR
jgi:hypothetical protein